METERDEKKVEIEYRKKRIQVGSKREAGKEGGRGDKGETESWRERKGRKKKDKSKSTFYLGGGGRSKGRFCVNISE